MKRIFDIFFAVFMLVLLMPIFGILVFLIYLDVGYPFFKQKRIGKNEKMFSLIKFKSMKDRNEAKDLITNEQRITKFGRFIRNYSLDELPSLINIIKGDMSFVGPRPLLVEYLDYYKPEHRARHKARPGLTGLAQVNGRNNISWQKRLDLDVEYAKNANFLLDLKILFQTIAKVIKKEGVESIVDLSIVRLDQDSTYLNNE